MDFLDPQKQRAHRIRLFIGYGLMSILIIMITTFLVYFSYGYNVSRDGQLGQSGLLFMASQPGGARIYVDDKQVGTTGARLVVPFGERTVRISRDGYHDWVRQVDVQGGSVDYFTYPFLVPRELAVENLKAYEQSIGLVTQSPDQRWLLTQRSDTDTFDIADLSSDIETVMETEALVVPANLLTDGTGVSWTLAEWSSDNRRVLLKRTFTSTDGAQTHEYVLIDREDPVSSRNMTRTLSLGSSATLSLRDKKYDKYYIHQTDTQQVLTASLDVPAPVVTLQQVLVFAPHGADRVLYITPNATNAERVDVLLSEGDAAYTLRTIARADSYLLNIAKYDDAWIVVFGSTAEGKTYLYKNPVAAMSRNNDQRPSPSFIFTLADATTATFSANTRFMALQNGKDVHIYDAEESESYRYSWARELDAPQKAAVWMDGHRLSYVSGGKQYIVDYDNINERELSAASSIFLPVFRRDYQYVFNIASPEVGPANSLLNATALRIPEDL